jgi:hypothetical protein
MQAALDGGSTTQIASSVVSNLLNYNGVSLSLLCVA